MKFRTPPKPCKQCSVDISHRINSAVYCDACSLEQDYLNKQVGSIRYKFRNKFHKVVIVNFKVHNKKVEENYDTRR